MTKATPIAQSLVSDIQLRRLLAICVHAGQKGAGKSCYQCPRRLPPRAYSHFGHPLTYILSEPATKPINTTHTQPPITKYPFY